MILQIDDKTSFDSGDRDAWIGEFFGEKSVFVNIGGANLAITFRELKHRLDANEDKSSVIAGGR